MTEPTQTPDQLSPGDRSAVDAFFEKPATPDPDAPLTQLLSLLDTDPAPPRDDQRRVLINATVARVLGTGIEDNPEIHEPDRLSPLSEDALEAYILNGYDPQAVPQRLRGRATKLAGALDLAERPAATAGTPARDLVASTLAHVQAHIDEEHAPYSLDAARRPSIRVPWRLRDITAIAALLLIGSAVVLPVLTGLRSMQSRALNASNLQAAGMGLHAYAADFDDQFALASHARPGTPWWNVGNPEQSNSANLFTLARTGYTPLENLACPSHAEAYTGPIRPGQMDWDSHEQVSYSYQNQFMPDRPRVSESPPGAMVITDRSPLRMLIVDRFFNNRSATRHIYISDPTENSPNHGGTGQSVLFADNSVSWLTTPFLESGDNIWLPQATENALTPGRSVPELTGDESPASPKDAFGF